MQPAQRLPGAAKNGGERQWTNAAYGRQRTRRRSEPATCVAKGEGPCACLCPLPTASTRLCWNVVSFACKHNCVHLVLCELCAQLLHHLAISYSPSNEHGTDAQMAGAGLLCSQGTSINGLLSTVCGCAVCCPAGAPPLGAPTACAGAGITCPAPGSKAWPARWTSTYQSGCWPAPSTATGAQKGQAERSR